MLAALLLHYSLLVCLYLFRKNVLSNSLKLMSDKRNYNIFFHLHTVSGITITVGLFIIFFAGAFTLFKDEIGEWETAGVEYNTAKKELSSGKENQDWNRIINGLEKKIPHCYGREFYASSSANSQNVSLYVSETTDTLFDKKLNKDYRLSYNSSTQKIEERTENYSFGELLYWLHFYYQLDRIGYYISGFVAFFFFFAIITGVIVHWKKTFKQFFVFRPKQKLKTIWTDAHTALGFIGLPFQFVYALTGSMFGLGILVAISNGAWVYNGDSEKMYSDVMEREATSVLGKSEKQAIDYDALVRKTEKKWDNFEVYGFHIQHFGSTSMTIEVRGEEHISSRFLGEGKVVYNSRGKEIAVKAPGEQSYYDNVWASVRRLHYAQFGRIGSLGSYLLKMVYFILALITCFVIVTGVLIWMEARNKKSISEKRRRYNTNVGLIYLSICLSMLPVTAAVFVLSKLIPANFSVSREGILNYAFFLGWLVVAIVFYFLKTNYRVNKIAILTTIPFALAIPLINGLLSGKWFWNSYANEEYGIFSVDIIWLLIGLLSLLVFIKLKKIHLEPGR